MQVGKFADLASVECAALALGAGGLTSVPHVKIDHQKPSALEDLQQHHRSMRANQRDAGLHLNHRELPSRSSEGVTLAGVGLFPKPQLCDLSVPGFAVNNWGA